MSKCEGCDFWFEDNDRQQPCCGARGGRYLEDIRGPCHLTPAAKRLITLFIEHGISDEDAAVAEQAIVGPDVVLVVMSGELAEAIKQSPLYLYQVEIIQMSFDDLVIKTSDAVAIVAKLIAGKSVMFKRQPQGGE